MSETSGTTQASESSLEEPFVDRSTFFPSLIVVGALSAFLILLPGTAETVVESSRVFVTQNFGWLFLLTGIGAFFFALWLAFGPYRHVKLGAENEPPEYSTTHWVAMMFTAGIGGGLIVWGFAEPIFYLQSPPYGIEPHSNEAIEWAHMYPMFHWGIVPWAVYVIPAVPIAYMLYVKREAVLRVSSACDGALPNNGREISKKIIDILIIFGIVGGTATALGLGIPLVSAFSAEFFGIEDTIHVKLSMLALWTGLFSFSVYRGLKRGIKLLADINMVLAVIAGAFILIAGPTLFIMKLSVNSMGLMLDNFFRMSLWTDPISKSGFPEDWTVFYWTWWLAFSAFIGLFVARISRGRTIQQLVLGVICWGSLGTWMFLAIASGYVLHLEVSAILPVSDILTQDGMSVLVAKTLATLPFGKLVLLLFIVLSIIFYATNVDSAAYVLASICSRNLHNSQEPPRGNRLIWALLLALLTAGFVVTGGMQTVQSASIVTALPLVPILILMSISLVRWLREDTKDNQIH